MRDGARERGMEGEATRSARVGAPRVKKIPPGLRRRRLNFRSEPSWYRRLAWRLRDDPHFLRGTVQLAFVLLCVWIGIEFHLFMQWGLSGGTAPYVERPPAVEGFLPISALISLKHWAMTGVVNDIHPAGLFIFLAILAPGLLLKKSFCSWLCPIGTLSESLWMLGRKLLGKNIKVPRWLDYPLRSLKYLLLAFFLWAIGNMDVAALSSFIGSPYNRMADVKMYLFFANISGLALGTIIVLMLGSVVIQNFWCRFLCPYGALLGIAGWLSPLKITRNASTCVDCKLCTKACPANIRVHTATRVRSDECTSCLECVKVCPVVSTLEMKLPGRGPAVPGWVFGVLVAGVFVAITGLAMLVGHWQNGIGEREYLRRFPLVNSPLYQHNQGQVPQYGTGD